MREKLIELLSESVSKFCKLSVIIGTTKITAISVNADEFADHLIANGVTIPVRCKDCKYAENMMPIDNGNGYLMGDCILRKEDDIIVTAWEDEFCSYGERRTDDRETG